MAIYGVGAYYGSDVSRDFITNNLAGVGWGVEDAPELHQFIGSLKVGDIIYIKAVSPSSPDIIVKAIGVVRDDHILSAENSHGLVQAGRNVHWVSTRELRVPKPSEKNNVRLNTIYEEYHPEVQQAILEQILPRLTTGAA